MQHEIIEKKKERKPKVVYGVNEQVLVQDIKNVLNTKGCIGLVGYRAVEMLDCE